MAWHYGHASATLLQTRSLMHIESGGTSVRCVTNDSHLNDAKSKTLRPSFESAERPRRYRFAQMSYAQVSKTKAAADVQQSAKDMSRYAASKYRAPGKPTRVVS